MSITDATTSLGTTWTEQSLGVAFTSGTLSTISSLVSEVEARLQRGTLSTDTVPTTTQVQNWLIIAKQELSESKNYQWSRRYAYCSTTAGTYRYGMPPDYNGGAVRLKNTTNSDKSRDIIIWPSATFDLRYPRPNDASNDEPLAACIKNMELWLAPPPDATYTIEMEYQRAGDDNTATDFSWLPQIERWRCCDFATARGFAMLHQFDAANLYKSEWGYALAKSRKADNKKKWTGRHQAISIFQEAAMRGYTDEPEGGHSS